MARLDRLEPAKEVLQIGAVIGSEFSYELLRTIHPIAEAELQHALHSLADAELLYVRGIAPDATYQFKHALIQDAAYEALVKSRRRELHGLVAHTIVEKFPSLKDTQPEILAHHWTEASEIEKAATEWHRAGRAAEVRNAFREALQSYQEALRLVEQLTESGERDIRELELRKSVVSMLLVTEGYSNPKTIEATDRAIGLAEKTGNMEQLVSLTISKCLSILATGDLPLMITLADQALELARRGGTRSDLAFAHTIQMIGRYVCSDLRGVEQHFTSGLEFFSDPGFRQFPGMGVSAFGVASWNAWLLGHPKLARERQSHMTTAAETPYDIAFSSEIAAQLSTYERHYEQAEILTVRGLEIAEDNGFPYASAVCRGTLGHARAQLGRVTEGIAFIRQGLTHLKELGSSLGVTFRWNTLAAAQERAGSIAEALETINQVPRTNPHEVVHRPETLRIRGELRLKQGQADMAEADFREAIAVAQNIGARAWELRATVSLARLLASQACDDEARMILAEIYNWFTEGFDTADLKEAKALLEELGSPVA